jgi:CheY-like chemotaxis protein
MPIVVDNGRLAVEAQQKTPYPLIFMDVQMPETGWATKPPRRFRRQERLADPGKEPGRKTTIIAMTAHAMEGDREKCLSAGMDDYISASPSIRINCTTLLQRSGRLQSLAADFGPRRGKAIRPGSQGKSCPSR